MPRYRAAIFDSDHWTRVHLRPGDVVLSTPPKCGTTWTLAMLYLILNGPDAPFDYLSRVAPWIDHRGAGAVPDGNGRRVFKTHTPLDGIPMVEGVDYIAVFRDPTAAFLSMRRHLANVRTPLDAHPNSGPWHDAFHYFLSSPMSPARFGGVTLANLRHYLTCANALAAMTLHYADMVSDHVGMIEKLAKHLGVARSEEAVREIATVTARRNMAAEADKFTPEAKAGFFKENVAFFTSDRPGCEKLVSSEEAMVIDAMNRIFDPPEVAWLVRGT